MRRIPHSPFFPILLAALVLLAPVYLSGKALFWGTPLTQFVPWWRQAWESMFSGHLPLWNPLVGIGAPLLANYQSALFYPPHWAYLLAYAAGGVTLMAWGQAVMVALHLAWAGIGMALLARRLSLGPLAMAVSGSAFGLSGYLVARAGFLSINATVAWLPWVICCLTPGDSGAPITLRRFMALLACLSMLLLAGHAQTAWYTLLLAGIWSGFWAWYSGRAQALEVGEQENPWQGDGGWISSLKRVGLVWIWLALGILLAMCLAAVQLLPTGEYLAQSQRAQAVEFDYALNYSFWPWHLITLAAPDMFGNPVRGDYWGYANYWEDAIYIGLLPLLLALGALLGSLGRGIRDLLEKEEKAQESRLLALRPPFAGFLFVLFCLALLLALGRFTPIFPWLYQRIPAFDMFQAPTRIMIWGVFALAILAGVGAQRWRRPENRALYWTRLGTAGAMAVTFGAGLAWYFMRDVSPSFIRASALVGVWGLGAGALSLTAPQRQPDDGIPGENAPSREHDKLGLWHWGVITLVILDLIVAGWGLNPGANMDIYDPSPLAEPLRSELKGRRIFLAETDEETIKYKRFFRFDTFDPGEDWRNLRATMLPNTHMLDDLRSANNFDPLVPGSYAIWMGALSLAEPPLRERMLELMAVGAIEKVELSKPFGVDFFFLEGGSRVRWLPCARPVANQERAWEQIIYGELDFEKEVLIEGARVSERLNCPAGDQALDAAQVSIQSESPNQVVIALQAPSHGWLALSDTWYPGWRAYVNGRQKPVWRANYLFRAVEVEAGEQQVVFVYRPLSFWLGAILSLVAWVVFLVFYRIAM